MQRRALIHHTIFNMKIAPAEVGYCVMGTTILSLARGQLDSWKRNNFNELNFYHRSRSYSALMWLRMAVPSLNIVPMSPASTLFLSMSPLWIHSFPSTRSYAYIIVLLLSFRFHPIHTAVCIVCVMCRYRSTFQSEFFPVDVFCFVIQPLHNHRHFFHEEEGCMERKEKKFFFCSTQSLRHCGSR